MPVMADGSVFDLLIFGFRNNLARGRALDFLNGLPPSQAGPAAVDRHTSRPQRLFAALDADRAHRLRAQLEELGAQVILLDVNAPVPDAITVQAAAEPPAPAQSGIRPFALFLVLILAGAAFLWRISLPLATARLPSTPVHSEAHVEDRLFSAATDTGHAIVDIEAEAIRLVRAREYAAAVERLQDALRRQPDTPALTQDLQTVLFNWGVTELTGNDLEQAAAHLQQAAALGDRAEVLAALGITYVREGDYDRATRPLEAAVRLNPTDPNALLALSQVCLAKNKRPAALELLDRAKDAGARGSELDTLVRQLSREVDAEWDFVQENSRHFWISFADNGDRSAVRQVLDALEDAYDLVGTKLGRFPDEPTAVVLYTQQDFHAVTQTPDWAGAAYDGRIKLPVRGLSENDPALARIVRHEYAHSLVARLSKGHCPVWLNEGLAVWAEEEHDGDPEGWAKNTIAGRELFSLDQLSASFAGLSKDRVEVAYAESYLAVRMLIDRYSARKLAALLEAFGTHNRSEAFAAVYPGDLSDFQQRFLQQLTG
jgi:tetratricopeptide (TPR) repeat protein